MTKFKIQEECGVSILLNPSEGNRELSEAEEVAYRKLMLEHRANFDCYFSDDYKDEDSDDE